MKRDSRSSGISSTAWISTILIASQETEDFSSYESDSHGHL
jgi:hypothetical protein